MQTHTISLEKAKTNALEEKSIVYTRYITVVVVVEKNIKIINYHYYISTRLNYTKYAVHASDGGSCINRVVGVNRSTFGSTFLFNKETNQNKFSVQNVQIGEKFCFHSKNKIKEKEIQIRRTKQCISNTLCFHLLSTIAGTSSVLRCCIGRNYRITLRFICGRSCRLRIARCRWCSSRTVVFRTSSTQLRTSSLQCSDRETRLPISLQCTSGQNCYPSCDLIRKYLQSMYNKCFT